MERIELKTEYSSSEISKKLIFNIIADIPKYPEFVPGYKKVEVIEKKENYIKVKIFPTIPIQPMIMEAYFYPYEKIKFKLVEGPLDIFEGEWNIKDNEITFFVNYYMKSWLKRKLVYKFVKISCNDILYSFKMRAKKIKLKGGGYEG